MTVTQNLLKLLKPRSDVEVNTPHVEVDAKELRRALLEIIPDCHKFHLLDVNPYGKVYKAHHRSLNRIVAVKLVRCINTDETATTTNTYTCDGRGPPKDFTILQSISHPHVLEILSVYRGGTGETTNIISEFMTGDTLLEYSQVVFRKQRAEGCRLGLAEIVCRDIMYQLCQAMAYVHRLGIVHRNLKLENIFLTGDTIPFIKVAGFGLAARVPDGGFLTEPRGSIDYMSPEMVRESSYGYDFLADSWSAGVLLAELLLLDNAYTTRRTLPEFTLPPFRWAELRDGRISAEGIELLEMLLAPDPALRYSVAAALQHKWLMYHRPMYPNVLYP
ncbi:kinase-like domain-containing protein [Mycena olivaceomarginata]|nr:kinase-like domain-containing protein [Mycena olivaceomarginata]